MEQPPNGNGPQVDPRQQIEADYTFERIYELRENPVRGKFDAKHLKEINRRIFQDLPAAGFTDVTPGQFRPEVEGNGDWIKNRHLESQNTTTVVGYSRMDAKAIERLNAVLSDVSPAKLSTLKTEQFTKELASLYVQLDYIHPFPDGNSRTLREFTHQLAKESGYTVEWEQFGKSVIGRDLLYVARDLSVNKIALPLAHHEHTMRRIAHSMHRLEGNRDLPELLKDVVRPTRAIAFERQSEVAAVAAHPELAEAFRLTREARTYFANKLKDDPIAQSQALELVVSTVRANLQAGETTNLGRRSIESGRTQLMPNVKPADRELDR